MDSTTLIILVLLAVVVALALLAVSRRQRSEELREHFGPEYERAVDQYGDKQKAESELAAREKRVRSLDIRPLSPDERDRFATAWQRAQARFVDEPSKAIADADRLVKEVMQARGYAVGDFEQRAADISVDHPDVVTNYRAAREIADRNNSGKATTEDLRQAMVHYRSLFEELLETAEPETTREVVR